MSPRAIPPATPPPLPKQGLYRASVARSHSRRGHAARELGSPISGGVLGARRESTQSDSAWYDARPGRSPVGASYREQPGSFPYVEFTPQYTPYAGNWRIRPGDPASVRKQFPPTAADFSRDTRSTSAPGIPPAGLFHFGFFSMQSDVRSRSAEFPGGKDSQIGTRIAHCTLAALRGMQLLQGQDENYWNGDDSMQAKTGLIVGLAGIGLGGGLMFFLDPARGKQRRAAVRDQAKRTSRQIGKAARSVDRSAHDLAKGADELTKRVFLWKRKAMRLVA